MSGERVPDAQRRDEVPPQPPGERDLRTLVPPSVRAGRLALEVVAVLALAYTSALAVTVLWAWATQPPGVDPRPGLVVLLVTGAILVALWLGVGALERVGEIELRGVVTAVSTREEGRGRRRPVRYVEELTLRVVDEHRDAFPFVAVELRARTLHGALTEGDIVDVVGRPSRDNYLAARQVRSEATGLVMHR
ncbi:MAG: hypothetical protein U0R80_07265 [Nocardioidaceae bacterium]